MKIFRFNSVAPDPTIRLPLQLWRSFTALCLQAMRYMVVGSMNSFIDFGALNVLLWMFEPTSTTAVTLCSATSYALSTLNAYIWHRRWTFRRSHERSVLMRFLFVNLLAFGLNNLVTAITVMLLSRFTATSWTEQANISKIAATAACGTFLFLTNRYWVFRKAPHLQPKGAEISQPAQDSQ